MHFKGEENLGIEKKTVFSSAFENGVVIKEKPFFCFRFLIVFCLFFLFLFFLVCCCSKFGNRNFCENMTVKKVVKKSNVFCFFSAIQTYLSFTFFFFEGKFCLLSFFFFSLSMNRFCGQFFLLFVC